MKEFFEELRNADSVKDVLLEHKKETLQLAVVIVVVMMAVLLYLHQGSTGIEISDAAGGDGSRAVQEGADGIAGDMGEAGNGGADTAGSAISGSTGVTGNAGTGIDTDGIVYVDIGGAVKQPMLAELPTGSRVEDAIQAAGGLTKKADLSQVNRAQILTDGEKIYIPEKGEAAGIAGGSGTDVGGSGSGENTGDTAALQTAGMTGGKININTADAVLLQQLAGVGPVTAQKIVDYREQNGKFTNIEELKNVSGIGEKTFEKMRDDVTI